MVDSDLKFHTPRLYLWHPSTYIFQFFAPLHVTPVRVDFEQGPNGRPTGEANVDFKTHQEAVEAMKNHKKNMGWYQSKMKIA